MHIIDSHRDRLIISADDFGISSRANRNILHLVSLGKIDRVGVMTKGIMSPKEIEELCRSGVKIDIHLDILNEIGEDRKHRHGFFQRILLFVFNFISGKTNTSKVNSEWTKQIEEFKSIFGKFPDGITSHEHVHYFPPYFKVALELQKEFQIPYLRFGKNSIHGHHCPIARILNILRKINLKLNSKTALISSDSLTSLDWFTDMDYFLDHLPEGTIEIACHPEIADDFVKIKKYF